MSASSLSVDFCGVRTPVPIDAAFTIGREGDLVVDDNPFLHRCFLTLSAVGDLWVLANAGEHLSATVSDSAGRLDAYLRPGAQLPLVFAETIVRFTAGSTAYELALHLDEPSFHDGVATESGPHGAATIGRVSLTPDQLLLVVALAEPSLRSGGAASATIPGSAAAAQRLGWTTTKFNRKLDNVCDKLTKLGVRGLRGDQSNLASNRRGRLVEYAVATRLVTAESLEMLDAVLDAGR